MSETLGLIRYDAMCRAIVECELLDEVLDIHDKAHALKIYAQQARNLDAERQACNIRLRAERRSGELLAELARATPSEAGQASGVARGNVSNDAIRSSPYADALSRTGLTRQTANRYERLAAVPAPIFEAALADPEAMPSTARVLRMVRDPAPELDKDALWLWGTLRDFERMKIFDRIPVDLLRGMTPTMQADITRLAPMVSAWLFVLAHGENYESA